MRNVGSGLCNQTNEKLNECWWKKCYGRERGEPEPEMETCPVRYCIGPFGTYMANSSLLPLFFLGQFTSSLRLECLCISFLNSFLHNKIFHLFIYLYYYNPMTSTHNSHQLGIYLLYLTNMYLNDNNNNNNNIYICILLSMHILVVWRE